jgi:hypothetical protein
VATDVARDLATSRREADQDDIPKIERADERREVIGVGVHLVAVPGLTGAAVAAAVVSDAAQAVGRQREHLRFPAVRVQRPSVAEHHGATGSPVLVEDAHAVVRGDRRHDATLHQPDGLSISRLTVIRRR